MIVLADSGASKTDWIVDDEKTLQRLTTKGFNPNRETEKDIAEKIAPVAKVLAKFQQGKIFFYCTGVGNSESKNTVRIILERIVPKGFEIHIETDILGAARASFGNESGLVGILGTGSSSAYYNGKEIVETNGGLGYILGDEGSSVHIGKLLLNRYFQNQLNQNSEKLLEEQYNITYKEAIRQVYSGYDGANYLARFPEIIGNHLQEHTDFQKVILDSFTAFITHNLLYLKNKHQESRVRFVGSIAYHFQVYLKKVSSMYALRFEEAIEKPIENLYKYHKIGA